PLRREAATVGLTAPGPPTRVSILSPSEEGLRLLHVQGSQAGEAEFQSSAPPKRGCDAHILQWTVAEFEFQSSAPPKRGCDGSTLAVPTAACVFQSSAPPKRGCDAQALVHLLVEELVSILSPSEEGLR